jgi:hypothetical protein
VTTVAPSRVPLRLRLLKPFRVFSSGDATYGYWKSTGLTYGELGTFTYGQLEFQQTSVVIVSAANALLGANGALTVSSKAVVAQTAFVNLAVEAPQSVSSRVAEAGSGSAQFVSEQASRLASRVTPAVALNAVFEAKGATAVFSQEATAELASAAFVAQEVTSNSQVVVEAVGSGASFFANNASIVCSIFIPTENISISFSAQQADVQSSVSANTSAVASNFDAYDASTISARTATASSSNAQFTAHEPTAFTPDILRPPAIKLFLSVRQPATASSRAVIVEAASANFSAQQARSVSTQNVDSASSVFAAQEVSTIAERNVSSDSLAGKLQASPATVSVVQHVAASSAMFFANNVLSVVVAQAVRSASALLEAQPTSIQNKKKVILDKIDIVLLANQAQFREIGTQQTVEVNPVNIKFDSVRPVVRNLSDGVKTVWSGAVYKLDPSPQQKTQNWLYPV